MDPVCPLSRRVSDAAPTHDLLWSAPGRFCRALEQHGLVVFRGVSLTPEQLEAIARSLGRVVPVRPAEERVPGLVYTRLQSNIPGVGVRGGGMYWHSDGGWRPSPSSFTLLYCETAPAVGGTTSFVDAAALLAELPESLRARVATARGFFGVREVARADLATRGIVDEGLLAELEDVIHPLVRAHAATGVRALILNEYFLTHIVDVSTEVSRALLADLYSHVEHSTHRYDHTWRAGDLVCWDNRSLLHRANPLDDAYPKTTMRVVVETPWQERSE